MAQPSADWGYLGIADVDLNAGCINSERQYTWLHPFSYIQRWSSCGSQLEVTVTRLIEAVFDWLASTFGSRHWWRDGNWLLSPNVVVHVVFTVTQSNCFPLSGFCRCCCCLWNKESRINQISVASISLVYLSSAAMSTSEQLTTNQKKNWKM